jgi:hypothetical protein
VPVTTPRRRSRPSVLARSAAVALLTALATLASCTVAGTPTALTDHDLGQGLVWSGPADADVLPFEPAREDGCGQTFATITVRSVRLGLKLLGADCPQSDQPPINGSHGSYLAPPDFAGQVAERGTVPTGALVTFQQTYSEYTNSRHDYTDTVGLVTMDSGDYAVLMLVRTGSGPDEAAITTAACAIRPAGSTPRSGSCPAAG